MSGFEFYAERARSAAARVAELERAIGRDPDNRALKINLASATKFFNRAEAQFREASIFAQHDVVTVR